MTATSSLAALGRGGRDQVRARHNPQVSRRPENTAMMKGASRQVGLLCIMAQNPPTPVANAAQLYLVRNKLGVLRFQHSPRCLQGHQEMGI